MALAVIGHLAGLALDGNNDLCIICRDGQSARGGLCYDVKVISNLTNIITSKIYGVCAGICALAACRNAVEGNVYLFGACVYLIAINGFFIAVIGEGTAVCYKLYILVVIEHEHIFFCCADGQGLLLV